MFLIEQLQKHVAIFYNISKKIFFFVCDSTLANQYCELPHIEASTEAAFVLLITTSQTQEFTVRYLPRTTSQGIITHQFFLTLVTYLVLPRLN
jgi:hypothetical protein